MPAANADDILPEASTRPRRNAVRDLLGVGKATFAALDGGERWLRREREAFHGSDQATTTDDPLRSAD